MKPEPEKLNDKDFAQKVIQVSESVKDWYGGNTELQKKTVKLFADGAIYSLLMQVNEHYTDGHEGEWIMTPDVFKPAFQIYWEADFQIHIHTNGDKGLDMVLDTLEENMRRYPRFDHRTTIVHFAVSAKKQVARIKKLGAIVSGNPYYVTALAEKYGASGLGPERAHNMVRLGDLESEGISYSLHSDMPMAPAQPLFLMQCAVTRATAASNLVAGPDQRISCQSALRAVTLDAAYSLNREKEMGSIVPGKLANFTILFDDPLSCDASKLQDISVWGTVHEGRVIPVPPPKETKPSGRPRGGPVKRLQKKFQAIMKNHAGNGLCGCSQGKFIGMLLCDEGE